jgi:uncharacterized protein (TIGR03067 family)
VAKKLPARPNLDHLRTQAKKLLADLKHGDASAVRTFIEHLPEARRMSAAKVRAADFRLADAQSVVARVTGFASWPLLSRHVQLLRLLEGDWRFVGMQVDGVDMPAAATAGSRILIDGDRFRMESPEATYDGAFIIDVGAEPMHIDIEFVEGPEAGNRSYGVFELNGDQLTICLGVVGASRPAGFSTRPGTGHALERLRRVSMSRPAGVTGGTRAQADTATPVPAAATTDPTAFDGAMTPMMRRLEGEWIPVQLVQDGQEMPAQWLAFGSRTARANEVKVVFGGQVMVHAKVRLDESATPVAIDYLNLTGRQKGQVSFGILEWVGDEVRILMAAPNAPRPASFSEALKKGLTLSQWRGRKSP